MPLSLIVPGEELPELTNTVDTRVQQQFGLTIQTRQAVEVGATRRGAGREVTVAGAEPDDLVELESVDGTLLWTRVASLGAQVAALDRSRVDATTIRVPATLGSASARGAGDWVLKGLKLLGFDPAGDLAGLGAQLVARHFEDRLEPGPGLYPLHVDGAIGERVRSPLPPGAGPLLVLLHGTFSSIGATFGALFRSAEWRRLFDAYGGRVYGLNHRTVSESPAQNALDLLELLPARARLHLVSHSRGGLVGELLARGPLTADALLPFEAPGRPADELTVLRRLSERLGELQPRIERFVRAACPARGTILASDRIDRYLSVVLNLIGLIPPVDDPLIFPFAKATILALIHKKAEPKELPGLEAMVPTSPYVRLLNLGKVETGADLAVIAGDTEGAGLLSSLGVLATDLFFRQDHDLVVNTDSMFKGVERAGGIYYSYEKGPGVTHFNYFVNDSSRERMAAWLLRQDAIPPGFRKLQGEPVPDLRRAALRAPRADAPVVFLLPTAFASHLRIGAERIWLDLPALAAGKLAQLALGGTAGEIAVDGLVAEGYGELVDHLVNRFEVVPFAWDWRASVVESCARLAVELDVELHRHERPVHLLAHGSGGLVARALITQRSATWRALTARGGRLVMLGTPQRGTQGALDLLTGQGRFVEMLALLDLAHDAASIARLFRTWPGLVELLPATAPDGGDARSPDWWTQRGYLGEKEATVFKRRLKDAQAVWNEALAETAIDDDAARAICCVAGRTAGALADGAGADVMGMEVADEIVLNGVPTWYVDAASSAIPRLKEKFRAIGDLIERGTTDQLSRESRPPLRGLKLVQPAPAPVLFPTPEELTDAALGRRPRRRREKQIVPLRVSVAHGSFEYARFPVAVGHYFGDVIIGSEAFLDRKLEGRLSQRYGLQLYPDEIGSAEVVLAPGRQPPGGIVVGLGQVGELTPEILTRGVVRAALRHALAVLNADPPAPGDQRRRSAAFSSVLIGTNSGRGLSIESAIVAVVQGALLANRMLKDQGLAQLVAIDEIEFIELYEDVATQAARIVRGLTSAYLTLPLEETEELELCDHLRRLEGGLPRGAPLTYQGGWWRRIQVSRLGGAADGAVGGLEFVLLTDRARAEQSLQATQLPLINQLVAQAIGRSDYLSSLHAALYELLLPNTIKDQAMGAVNLLFVLDEVAAGLPWEMLGERDQDPLAIRTGLLRQLKTLQFRSDVRAPRGNYALVVGDPTLGGGEFPQLPGAAAEARAVAAELRKHGYEVVELVSATALDIVSALYAHEYRIIHIAAHGFYDGAQPARSGVVIGPDTFLTAAEIGQLRVVPELVFLNCCHLAQIDQPGGVPGTAAEARLEVAPPPAQQAWSRLAASVAQELIRIGVRAIVAAGWAVNDAAAEQFATRLYGEMLAEDRQFGDAVHHARQHIFERFDQTNTWGAYQCYGMPAFVLGGGARRQETETKEPVAKHEVLEDLDRLRMSAEGVDAARRKALLAEVRAWERTVRAEWRTADTLYALAEAYAALDEEQAAIDYFRQALASKEARPEVPVRAIEQLADLEARYAEKLQHQVAQVKGKARQKLEAEQNELLRTARKRLLLALRMGQTPARLALLGDYYRRLAVTTTGSRRTAALRRAATNYRQAAGEGRQATDLGPILLWVECRYLADWPAEGKTRPQAGISAAVDAIAAGERLVRESTGAPLTRHERLLLAQAAVLRSLLAGRLEEERAATVQLYRAALAVSGSSDERAQALRELEFLAVMLEWREQPAWAATLRQIRDELEG
jgi:CHAT domain-containing protein